MVQCNSWTINDMTRTPAFRAAEKGSPDGHYYICQPNGSGFRQADRLDSIDRIEEFLSGNKGAAAQLLEVVGVTVTGKRMVLIEATRPLIYLPFSQQPQSRMTMIAETFGDPASGDLPRNASSRRFSWIQSTVLK
jgi:hypothetical protein